MRFEATLPDDTWADVSMVGRDTLAVHIKWGLVVAGERIVLVGSRTVLAELGLQILRLAEMDQQELLARLTPHMEGADDGPVE